MKRFAFLLALVLASRAPAAGTNRTQVGLWYTAWWTADDARQHWSKCHRLPVLGRYGAGDPAVISNQVARFRAMGVDFLVMDDTNGRNNDGGRIRENIRAWFDFMDAQPASNRIPICIGGGGEMRHGGAPEQRQAAEDYWNWWAQRPAYFILDGRPLLLVDTDTNYKPGDFDDPRFAVRWVYNSDNSAEMRSRRTWGWGSREPVPALEESMAIMPGQRYPGPVEAKGFDPNETPREGGALYARMWLAVFKARPRFVTIADWNNFQEETALEDSWSWEDRDGRVAPDLYTRMTTAAIRLLRGALTPGCCYAADGDKQLYRCDGARLTPVERLPPRSTALLMPSDWLPSFLETAK